MPPAYLFDLDGTLVDRLPSLRAFLPRQLERCGAGGDAEAYLRRFLELDAADPSKERLYGVLREEFGLRSSVEELTRDFRANAYRRAFLFPGARRVLAELRRRGCRLAIASNGSAEAQRAKIGATGLSELVDAVLISGEIGLRKPDPAFFRRAAAAVGAEPHACVFVGDDPRKDVAGARGVGMGTVWVAHGRRWPAAAGAAPGVSLAGLEELLEQPDLAEPER